MTKIVFINPYEYTYLGTRCLASWLQANGFATHNVLLEEHQIIHVDTPREEGVLGYQSYYAGKLYENKSIYNPLEEKHLLALETILKEQKPDIIAWSARSVFNGLLPPIMPVLKKAAPNALLVAGGFGPTLDPDLYLKAGFDVVGRGDGEEEMLAIARAVENKNLSEAFNVPGTWWHERWGGRQNGLPDQVKDISVYPPLLSGNEHFSYIKDGELHRNIDPVLDKRTYMTFFGRGCIGKCSYCSGGQWSALYRDEGKKAYKRRNRNVDDLMSELKKLPPNIKTINFVDEYWAMSVDETKKFFTTYKENIGLPFSIYLSYDQIVKNDDLLNLLVEAGLAWTGVGFQTGSNEFAKKYYNRSNNYDVLLNFSHKIFSKKVILNPQFIGGNCYESWDVFLETIKLIQKLPFSIEEPNFSFIQNVRLKPHPHSPLRVAYPEVADHPMPVKEWHYRAILGDISRLLSYEEFLDLTTVKGYRKDPVKLQKFYELLLFNKQNEHFNTLIEVSRHDDWVYYGHGEAYKKTKSFFKPLNPKFIIVDQQYMTEKNVDGIPVISTEDFFAENDPAQYKILNFINDSPLATRGLMIKHKVPYGNIHSCPVSWISANFLPMDKEKL